MILDQMDQRLHIQADEHNSAQGHMHNGAWQFPCTGRQEHKHNKLYSSIGAVLHPAPPSPPCPPRSQHPDSPKRGETKASQGMSSNWQHGYKHASCCTHTHTHTHTSNGSPHTPASTSNSPGRWGIVLAACAVKCTAAAILHTQAFTNHSSLHTAVPRQHT